MSTRMMSKPTTQHHLARIAAALTLSLAATFVLSGGPERVAAQAPLATEEQAIAIERQLMCPVCPNERLDTSQNAVARDMKRIIREQLANGRTPDEIILFFESRYGPIVRADLEAEGFNLFLYGWIGAALLTVAAGGGWYLWLLRRRSRVAVAAAPIRNSTHPAAPDDAWLDEQLGDV